MVGGQYGSEGKGAVAAYLTRKNPGLMAVRVAGPNAGHTVVDSAGQTFKFRHLPVAAVVGDGPLVLAAGSEIDEEVLAAELQEAYDKGHPAYTRFQVDQQATVIEPAHKQTDELLVEKIGSTGKGIGSARAARIMRSAKIIGDKGGRTSNTAEAIRSWLWEDGEVLIEGTQGYGLGLHAGEYPYCTSSDCRAIDFMAMAGVCPWWPEVDEIEIWVVVRTFPIRVAGNSGRLEGETTWEKLGLQEERTTVTNKVRRVGAWDGTLVEKAILANGGPRRVKLALTMADYLIPDLKGKTNRYQMEIATQSQLENLITSLENSIGWRNVFKLVGTSPSTMLEYR